MTLSFPVDLRRGRGLPNDSYGCFVSEARVSQRVNPNASTVALARRLDRELKTAVDNARPWNEKLNYRSIQERSTLHAQRQLE